MTTCNQPKKPMNENLLTLYYRREPTTDETWVKYGPSRPLKRDLVLYSDEEGTKEKALIPWHQSASKARKYVTINGYRWKILPVKHQRKEQIR